VDAARGVWKMNKSRMSVSGSMSNQTGFAASPRRVRTSDSACSAADTTEQEVHLLTVVERHGRDHTARASCLRRMRGLLFDGWSPALASALIASRTHVAINRARPRQVFRRISVRSIMQPHLPI
jgi:hypothetical protein